MSTATATFTAGGKSVRFDDDNDDYDSKNNERKRFSNPSNGGNILLRVKRRRTDPPAACLVLVEPSSSTARRRHVVDTNDNYRSSLVTTKRKTRENDVADLTAACLSSWQLGGNATTNSSSVDHLLLPTSVGYDGEEPATHLSKLVTTTVWKRRDLEADTGEDNTTNSSSSLVDRPCQVVEAMLEDVVVDANADDRGAIGAGASAESPSSWRGIKRRRLTLIEPVSTSTITTTASSITTINSTTSPNHRHTKTSALDRRRRRRNNDNRNRATVPFYPVLDPLSRLVDDSLRAVHVGDVLIGQHWQLLTTNVRLLRNDGTPDSRWYTWNQSTGGGNILHACALWNDIEMLKEIIQTSCAEENHGTKTWLSVMLQSVNSDGWTPHQVAQLAGHDDIVQILETVGGAGDVSMEADFVYDEYWLCPNCGQDDDDDVVDNSKGGDVSQIIDAKDMLTVELQGGYWDNGELVFSPEEEQHQEEDLGVDDEEDSNSEGYAGNDYPDDNEKNVWHGVDDDDDESQDNDDKEDDSDGEAAAASSSFRNRPVQYGDQHLREPSPWSAPHVEVDDNGDDNDNDAGDEYEDWYGDKQVGPERQFAYDPRWDDDDDE